MPIKKRSESLTISTKDLYYFLPALVWGGLVFYFSLMPGNEVPDIFTELNDKLIHAWIYFISAGLIYLGFIRYNFNRPASILAMGINMALCIVMGGVIELIQHFWIANRNGDWQDFAANATGSLICVLLFRVFHGVRA